MDLEIDKICGHKIVNDRMYFLVQWKNIRPEYNVWLQTRHILSIRLILDYCKQANILDIPVPTINQRCEELFELLGNVSNNVLNSFCKTFTTVKEMQLPKSNKQAILRCIESILNSKSIRTNEALLRNLRERVMIEKIIERRGPQLDRLQEQEWWLNLLSDNKEVIKLCNNADLEVLPTFKYVNNYVTGPDIIIMENTDEIFACSGEHKYCTKKCNCVSIFSDKMAYDRSGAIVSPRFEGVHECNKLCSCGPDCGNRVVQKGTRIKLEIFRSCTGTGWGVRTLEFLPRGSFVGRYVGRVISWEEGELLSNTEMEGQYLFDIDYWIYENGQSKYTVDAFSHGNFTRFINHSCSPNLTVYKVWINCLDPHLHEIAFFTVKNIEKGEEITFDYRKLFEECKCGSNKCVPLKPT